MKKYFINFKITIILFIFILLLSVNNYITYAETLDYCSEIEFNGWYVSIDDIYALREKYEENPELEVKKARDFLIERAGNFWRALEVWLEYMKKLYPEYSYESLFHMAYVSRDKSYYTDFDTELEEFSETLPYIENAQLYDIYAKEVNESGLYTAEEKRNRFVWKLLQVEKELENLQKLDNNEFLAYFGFGVLIVFCAIFTITKRNKKLMMNK